MASLAASRSRCHPLAIATKNLPSGAVTFLFTDIEGSTRLVKQLRDRYEEVLTTHQSLLRAAFAAHRGHEIDTQGDSFFVAFSSARDAVLAAVEGQLALRTHIWPENVEVNVRMGIHTGESAAGGGRYTGLAVHRAARICAAGHGGQVLVSQTTQNLLADEEEDLHISLRDLGDHQLKDLDRPVHLYQADTDGLPTTFPPLRTSGEMGPAAEAAVAPPLWRGRVALAAAVLLAGLAAAVFLWARSSGSRGASVEPNNIVVIDPETSELADQIAVGSEPGPLASGDGSVWVGNLQDRTITRVSLKRRIRTATIGLNDRTPTGVTFGAGNLWVANGLRGQLSRVDPRVSRVSATVDVADPGSNGGAVAVGAGSVWVAYGDSTIARVDPRSAHVTGATFAGASPAGVVVGNGSVWITNSGDATVTRFSAGSFEGGAAGRRIRVGHKPTGIAYGAGAVWVADTGDDAVTRIDPFTGDTIVIPVGAGPTAVAVGGGLVWVANTVAGTVSRVDPVSNKVVATIKVGNAPSGIVFAGGFVWVAVRAP
jgi:YVTN family beta-propeller protein